MTAKSRLQNPFGSHGQAYALAHGDACEARITGKRVRLSMAPLAGAQQVFGYETALNPTRLARLSVMLFAVAACTIVASCSSLSQATPDKAFFAIDPGKPVMAAPLAASADAAPATATTQTPAMMPAGAVLQVRRLRVATPYDGLEFVYRTKSDEYRTDYYNGFIAAPDHMLTAALIDWLSREGAGPFASVVDIASSIPARYVLEGNVTSLYGDYTNKAAPRAVMAIKIFLFDDGGANVRVIFQKQYDAAAPIDPGSAEGLVKGWNNAFRQILERITADLDERSRAGL